MSADPRVYFAAERTLLAWVRTGIAVMAFGFVVARFGLAVGLPLVLHEPPPPSSTSAILGAALVVVGLLSIGAGAVHYQQYCRTIRPEDLPSPHPARLPLTLSWLLVAIGVIVAASLLT